MRNGLRSLIHSLLLACASTLALTAQAETNPRQYAVEVSASVLAAPPQITLRWAPDSSATGYAVYRKAFTGTSWMLMATLGNVNSWTDQAVANGAAYEYSIQKTTSLGYKGTGYIYAGLNAPMTESRGKVVLVVENTHASALAAELGRLQQDLVGDGWTVVRHNVSRHDTPVTVKNLIRGTYNSDPANVKSVFLFGRVPVPYSGNFNPDGHPDHQGAWVADTYYGDMNGTWTDSTVNNTTAEKAWNRNVPGDGKFDQSDLPSDIELQVGRVDMFNLTCFANKTPSRSELDLLRAYLNKHHAFRHGRVQLNRRGLVCDNFGERNGEAFASTGWRSFAPFFGAEQNVQAPYGTYFSTLKDQAYLWSYGTGGGSWYTCNGVGSSDDFALNDIKSVFTTYLGSYFGDWDNESNFLRASLGSGNVLATAWGGRPHWFFHHMGLGETIGHSARLSQNNGYGGLYAPQNFGTRRVHISLLGDPTLRMHPVIPPSNVNASTGAGVSVTWTASTDIAIQGYVVYRGSSLNGPFTRISGASYLTGTSFTDVLGTPGSVYMVRAVKLEQSGSGTYLNPSQGIFATAGAGANSTPAPTAPSAPSNLSGSTAASTSITLRWTDNSSNESGFRILRKAGLAGVPTVLNAPMNATTFTDTGLAAGTVYYYQVYAWNSAGNSLSTPEIGVNIPAVVAMPSTATFLGEDWTTRGHWKAIYGQSGQLIVNHRTNLPVNFTLSGANAWTGSQSTTALSALEKFPGPDRFLSAWYSATSMSITLNLADGVTHRVAVYCADTNRRQSVEILDANGNVLSSRTIDNFGNGVYLVWELRGQVTLRFNRLSGNNAVVSGIFFGTGGYNQSAQTPQQPSAQPSTTGSPVRFLGANTTTRGTWKGTFGTQGYQLVTESASLPASVTVTPNGKADHVWNWNSSDAAALQKSVGTDRLAACWYSGGSFDVRVNAPDTATRKVTLYCLDWDKQNRTQTIDVLDSAGQLIHTTNLASFQTGVYLSYDVKGAVTFRFTRSGPHNSVVSGIFFDAPSAPL